LFDNNCIILVTPVLQTFQTKSDDFVVEISIISMPLSDHIEGVEPTLHNDQAQPATCWPTRRPPDERGWSVLIFWISQVCWLIYESKACIRHSVAFNDIWQYLRVCYCCVNTYCYHMGTILGTDRQYH